MQNIQYTVPCITDSQLHVLEQAPAGVNIARDA